MPFDPHLPDTYFCTKNLIAEWDKLTFEDISDTSLREVLNGLKEFALNKLSDPSPNPSTPKDVKRALNSAQAIGLLKMQAHQMGESLQPHHRAIYEQTLALEKASNFANTHLEQRLKKIKDASNSATYIQKPRE